MHFEGNKLEAAVNTSQFLELKEQDLPDPEVRGEEQDYTKQIKMCCWPDGPNYIFI